MFKTLFTYSAAPLRQLKDKSSPATPVDLEPANPERGERA
jgi:hypothetical protein